MALERGQQIGSVPIRTEADQVASLARRTLDTVTDLARHRLLKIARFLRERWTLADTAKPWLIGSRAEGGKQAAPSRLETSY